MQCRFKPKISTLFGGAYLALVVASVLYIFARIRFFPANSEFCGLPLVMLSSPWSIWLIQFLHEFHFNFDRSVLVNTLLMLPGALVNIWLAYLMGSLLDKQK